MPGLLDLLPALLMLEPPQIQGLGGDKCEWGPRAPSIPPTLPGAAYLQEGLGQQRAHCLHQAVAELQVLF